MLSWLRKVFDGMSDFHENIIGGLLRASTELCDQARCMEALEPAQRAVEVGKKHLSQDHPARLMAECSLAYVHNQLGHYRIAQELYEHTVPLLEGQVGKAHPVVLTMVNNLAATYENQACYEQAELSYHRVLRERERALPKDHPSILSILNNLGHLYIAMGRYRDAEDNLSRAREASEKQLGAEHPMTLGITNNMALLRKDQGRMPDPWVLCLPYRPFHDLVAEPRTHRQVPPYSFSLYSGARQWMSG